MVTDAARSVNADFVIGRTLTVDRAGTGTVTSSPAGIGCGLDCAEPYDEGTSVTLTAAPDAGSVFTGWSGGGCGGTGNCVVTMDAAKTVTATFTLGRTLTVNITGAGSGSVASDPGGITCPTDCTESFLEGTTVTLTATAGASSRFSGWSGSGCAGTGTCTVTMDVNKSVTATFVKTFTLTVTRDGTGAGTVTSSPAGITCGADCSEAYDEGTVVTLTATPDPLHTFVQWGGACTGTAATCTVTMDLAKSVTATFL